MLNKCLACAQPGGVIAQGQVLTAVQTTRGIFVSTTRRVYFYSHHALRSGGQPTASIPTARAGSIAPDGRGVVIGAGRAGLIHWVPGR
jgi:hypothetical protein